MSENKTRDVFGKHVIQYPENISLCAGCSSCEIVCGIVHEGISSPSVNRIWVEKADRQCMRHTILTCHHCSDHPCYEACPEKDTAMRIDETGIVYIDEENCIGCGLCLKACKFDPPRINLNKKANLFVHQ